MTARVEANVRRMRNVEYIELGRSKMGAGLGVYKWAFREDISDSNLSVPFNRNLSFDQICFEFTPSSPG